jgi:hypothetical protein
VERRTVQDVIVYLARHPWIWIACLLSSIATIVVVARSPKFLRKGLWVFLCLVSYAHSARVGPDIGLTITVAPIGALYVLWFWRFGPAPTAERVARHAERRAKRQALRDARASKTTAVRSLYVCAAGVALLMGALTAFGALTQVLADFGAPKSQVGLAKMFALAGFVPALVAFVFLAFRPEWWGKLLCVWAGLSWIGFSLVSATVTGFNATLMTILAAGVAMFVIALAHQPLDTSFGGRAFRGAR